MSKPDDIGFLGFDVFGTVVDWRSGVARAADPFLCRHQIDIDPLEFADQWRSLYQPSMERVFRSLKSEWIPTTGYLTGQQAQRDIGQYLMGHYNWIRPHQFNDGLAPAKAEEKLKTVSGMS